MMVTLSANLGGGVNQGTCPDLALITLILVVL